MQKTPYKNPKKILAQIWRTLKRKISATCCFTTRYADFGGERGILYHSTSFRNSLIFKCRLWAFSLILHEKWRRTGARQNVLKHCV